MNPSAACQAPAGWGQSALTPITLRSHPCFERGFGWVTMRLYCSPLPPPNHCKAETASGVEICGSLGWLMASKGLTLGSQLFVITLSSSAGINGSVSVMRRSKLDLENESRRQARSRWGVFPLRLDAPLGALSNFRSAGFSPLPLVFCTLAYQDAMPARWQAKGRALGPSRTVRLNGG
jgi:hypothetical protein